MRKVLNLQDNKLFKVKTFNFKMQRVKINNLKLNDKNTHKYSFYM